MGWVSGEHIVTLSKQPSQQKLRRSTPLLFRNLLQFRHKFQILAEILFRKPRGYLTEIFSSEIVSGFNLSGEEAATEGGVGYGGYAEFATGF